MNILRWVATRYRVYRDFLAHLPNDFKAMKSELSAVRSDLEAVKVNTDNILWTVGNREFFFGGERQVVPYRSMIRKDHVERYTYAGRCLKEAGGAPRVVDIACGVGYGSTIIADMLPAARIVAYDINEMALDYARAFYRRKNIDYRIGDIEKLNPEPESCDAVISYETIEHIPDYRVLLALITRILKPSGVAFLSTPNESSMPYNPESFPYHVRHFALDELRQAAEDHGLRITEVKSQSNRESGVLQDDDKGVFLILRLHKSGRS